MVRIYRKWKIFTDNYLRLNLNGTRAYKATYGDHLSDEVAATAAGRLLRKVQVQEYISERIAAEAMGPEEVLLRLGRQARSDIGDLYDPATNTIDMRKAIATGRSQLIKRVKQTVRTKDDEEIIFTDVELYDSQAALQLIGRHHKLFTDVSENTLQLNITGKDQLLDRIYGDRDEPTN